MAERRQRPAPADRRLISDRTAKSLRMLTAPQRIYGQRFSRGATTRRLNLTDYLTLPPEEMDVDDDNDSLESLLDANGGLEGARVYPEVYDAIVSPAYGTWCHSSRLCIALHHRPVKHRENSR